MRLAAAASLLVLLAPSHAFYLPGVAPHEYQDGEAVGGSAGPSRLSLSPRPRAGGL